MKKSFSKRMLALFLAVVMVITAVPMAVFAAGKANSAGGGYLMAYFKDNSDKQRLYFSLSKDGYSFEELNGDQEIPLDYSNTKSNRIRDPFIFQAQNDDANGYKYYVIATDMDANKGWDSVANPDPSVFLWGTHDIAGDWEPVTSIDLDIKDAEGSLGKLVFDKLDAARNTSVIRFWAPEVIWDAEYERPDGGKGAYMITFGLALSNWSVGTRLYYTHTLDFKSFYDFDALLEPTRDGSTILDCIDSDLQCVNGTWYMLFKLESDTNTGDASQASRVFVTQSKSGRPEGPYYSNLTTESEYIHQISRGSTPYEGPLSYRIEGTDTYVVGLDDFTNKSVLGQYTLYQTGDWETFEPVPTNEYEINFEREGRHASVVHITDAEYDALVLKYGKFTNTQTNIAIGDVNDHLVARYFVDTDPTKDVSGNGHDVINGVNGEYANLDGKTIVKNGKLCVDFSGNAVDIQPNASTSSANPPTSNKVPESIYSEGDPPWVNYGAVGNDNRFLYSRDLGTYFSVDTAELLKNTDVNQGASISFDAMTTAEGVARSSTTHVIDISNAKDYGYISTGNGGLNMYPTGKGNVIFGTDKIPTSTYELSDNDAAKKNATDVFVQMDKTTSGTLRTLKNNSETTNTFNSNVTEWHTYTITFTKGIISIYVDGVRVQYLKNTAFDADWFNALLKSTVDTEPDKSKLLGKSKLGIGVSHWIADYLFDGYVADLCIYDRCLSYSDIAEAQEDLLNGETISVSQGQLIYQDLVTEDQFAKYDSIITGDDTNGYGDMLKINGTAVNSAEVVEDCENTISTTGYSYNFWINPGDAAEDMAVIRQGNDQRYFAIKENGVVEFNYGDNITFTSDKLFELTPNKVQNVTVEVIPFASYDRIIAYVDGKMTGHYDAYLAAETTNYPDKTLLSFINDTNTSVNENKNVTYGAAGSNSVITGVTIHRGAIDGRELYLDKFADLAETMYLAEFKEFEDKILEFNITDKLYKNMNVAYTAYDKVKRYADAVEYGNQEPDMTYLSEIVTELKLANDKMVPYEGKGNLTTMDVQYSNDSGTYDTTGMSNGVLYATPVSAESGAFNNLSILSGNPSASGCKANVLYNDTLFVYDGTSQHLAMPVWLSVYRDDNTNNDRYISSAYPTPPGDYDPNSYPEPAAKTNGYASGYEDGANPASAENPAFSLRDADGNYRGWAWNGNTIGSVDGSIELGYNLANTLNNTSGGSMTKKTTGTNHYWINRLDIDTAALADYPDVNGNTGSISGRYKLNWHVYGCNGDGRKSNRWFYRDYSGGTLGIGKKDNTINRTSDSIVLTDQPSSLYILDTTGLDIENENCPLKTKDPTVGVHEVVASGENDTFVLSSEVSSELLKAIDMYTSFDDTLAAELNKGNTAAVMYNNLVEDINNAATDYDEAYSEVMKSFTSYNAYMDTDYDNLKAELKDNAYLDKLDSIAANRTIDGTETYTTDSCAAYLNKYEAAVEHFASLDPRNADGGASYATEDGITSDTATNLYNDILEADSKLMPVADYEQITQDYNDSMSLSLGNPVSDDNTVEQNYSVKSWLGLAQPQADAAQYVNTEQAVKNNTPKYTTYEDGVVNRDSESAQQIEIKTADTALVAAVDALAQPAHADVLETYNAAQRLAERVDLDAYTTDARQPILDNFNLGYYSADNTVKNAQAPAEGSVYVAYGDGVYIYGDNTDTENATKTVLEALNVTYIESSGTPVKVGGYTVTVNVFIDGTDTPIVLPIATHLYGTDTGSKVRIDANAYNNGTYDVAKWTVQSENSKATLINQTGFVIDRVIQQNTIVNLYLTTKVADATKVTVYDCFGVQLDVAYVSGDFEMTSAAEDAKLVFTAVDGQHEIDATQSNGFTFTKWEVSKSTTGIRIVQRADKENNEQYALYKVQGGTINNTDGTAGIYVNFNEYVTFVSTSDNFFAWVKSLDGVNWYVASYDANFRTISAPTDANGITYKTVTADEFKALGINSEITNEAIAVKSPFSFGTAVAKVDNKFRLYCDFSVNSNMNANVEVIQYGVLYTAADVEPENFIKGADGIRTGAANACSDCNTYTMTLTPKSGTNTYMRSYVSYMYTTKDKDGNDVKVPLVAYGPVVTCDASGNISR